MKNYTFEPPRDADVSRAVHDTINRSRALGLLAVGADWHDRSYGFTDTQWRSNLGRTVTKTPQNSYSARRGAR